MNDLKGIIEDCNKSDLVSDRVIKKVIEIIGQEKWQDLHDENNDVCTTMGELIITLNGIADLEKENAELKKLKRECETSLCRAEYQYNYEQLTKAKEIMNIAIEGIKHWGIVGGTERPFEKQAEMLFNLFLDKAEQFIKDSEVKK